MKEQILKVLFPDGLTQGNLEVFVKALSTISNASPKNPETNLKAEKVKAPFRFPKGFTGNGNGRPYSLDRADRAWEGDKHLLINFASKQVREHYEGYETTVGPHTYYVLTRKNKHTPFRDESMRRADLAWSTTKRLRKHYAVRDVKVKYPGYIEGDWYVMTRLAETNG